MEHISADIITQILLRVPADCITKLELVCKLWNSIITDAKFFDSNFQQNLSNSPKILLSSKNYIRVIDPKSWSILHISSKKTSPYTGFAGSCNGLICVYSSQPGHIATVINPATRESFNLVRCSTNPKWQCSHQKYCLGFDSATNKCKVARMCRTLCRRFNGQVRRNSLVEVCNVSNGDISWRQVGASLEVYPVSSGVYYNGGLYWLAKSDYDNLKIWLLWFDLKEEKIFLIDGTKCDVLFNLRNYKDRCLLQLNGRLSLHANIDNIINIWMMGDNINNWYLKYSIRVPCNSVMRPLFVTGRKVLNDLFHDYNHPILMK